jgi:hypothetical protein
VAAFRPMCTVAALVAMCSLPLVSVPARAAGLRCGWFDNPSPGNASLFDKEGEWIIAIQGGHQAMGDWPSGFAPKQWIRIGAGHYGYGCACLDMTVNAEEKTVLEIKSGKARPLSLCRKDPAVAKVEKTLR